MQKLKIKQIDGVLSPAASDDWSALAENLATAASVNAKINSSVSAAVGGTIQSVTGGSAESGKYVSAIAKDGTAIKVIKTAIPVTGVSSSITAGSGTTTKAVVGISLSSGKIVATEKEIAFPAIPHLAVQSADFVSEIALDTPAVSEGSVLVFVNGLLQSPADLIITTDKVSFKDPSAYIKGDAVNIIYMAR